MPNIRFNIDGSLSESELIQIRDDKNIQILQTSKPLEESLWKSLNDIVFSTRKDITMRVYGYYSQECNLKFVRKLTNVERFSADCIRNATEVENISYLENLKSLSIGIGNLESFGFLDSINENLEDLKLCATLSKKPSLEHLKKFKKLKQLYLERQSKNIDVLLELENIEDITLRSISTFDVSYLANMKKLWLLNIQLGGIKGFSTLEGMDHIKYLELFQIRGLNNLGFVSELKGLQYLSLQNLPQLQELPSFVNLKKLRRLELENLKGIKDFSRLKEAEMLEEFAISYALSTDPEELRILLSLPNLKRACGGFGSDKKNKYFDDMLKTNNITDNIDPFHFEFR